MDMSHVSDAFEYGGELWSFPIPPPIMSFGNICTPAPEIAEFNYPEFSGFLFPDGYQCVWFDDDGYLAIKSIHGKYELSKYHTERAHWVSGTFSACLGSPFEGFDDENVEVILLDITVKYGRILSTNRRKLL